MPVLDKPALGSKTVNGISTEVDANGNPIIVPIVIDPVLRALRVKVVSGTATATPGGTTTQLQYNNAGLLGGFGAYDGVTVKLPTLTPATNDAAALGTGLLGFSDLFLASGGVINWANGDVTLTHASNALSFLSTAGTGLSITGAAAGSGVTIAALSSGNNEDILVLPKGTGKLNVTGVFAVNPGTFFTTVDSTAQFVISGTTAPAYVDLNPGIKFFLRSNVNATSGATSKDSVALMLQGNRWTGSASANVGATILVRPKATATDSYIAFGFTDLDDQQLVLTHNGRVGIGLTGAIPTYGLHLAPTSGLTAGQTLFVQDATVSTGKTTAVLKGGAVAGNILEIRNSSNTLNGSITDAGLLSAVGLYASGDGAGIASTTGLSNATDTTTTNAYVVGGGQAATTKNTGWAKIYIGTTVAWVPYWANATP